MPSCHLTKSRYIAGLQCLRRLWRLVHEPRDYEDAPPGSPLAMGEEIGRAAHQLFPGGGLVAEAPWQHTEAAKTTRALMLDPAVSAIFEAAFEHAEVRIRVDVLERLDGGAWGLREVKGSTRVKDYHLDDLAIQAFVLTGAGVPIASIELLHVNNRYVRGGDGICWPAYFTRADVMQEVEGRRAAIPGRLPAMRAALALAAAPFVEPGAHCGSPYDCEFYGDCTAAKPEDWVARLPRLMPKQAASLAALGIEAISAIPPEFPLSWQQSVIRGVLATGQPYVAPDLTRLLGGYGPPAAYLDFEAMMPPIPLYEGTSPYQTLPFQWSLHEIDAADRLTHREFLAPHDRDPRCSFAETLVAALAGSDHPILVYSSYEQTQLRALAAQIPALAGPIGSIIARLRDLLPVVRGTVYFPAFAFSNSIKSVAPALAPGFGYDDLSDIADGTAAAAAFLQLACGQADDPARLRAGLLAYCERDTLAMVEVHRALMRLACQEGALPHPAAVALS
jgi:hypothetical protein